MTTCDETTCTKRIEYRAYASYNADNGENVHPLHARYPAPMIRACAEHLCERMAADAGRPGSTLQWLVVRPTPTGEEPGA
jgi:hypothetical protein